MNKVLVVALREFIDVVRTRTFLIGVVLTPLLVLAAIFGADRLTDIARQEREPLRTLILLDEHGGVFDALATQVDAHNEAEPNRPFALHEAADDQRSLDALRQEVAAGRCYGFIVVPHDAVAGDAPCSIGRQDNQLELGQRIKGMLDRAIVVVRCRAHEPPLDPALIDAVTRDVHVSYIDVQTGAQRGDDRMARALTPFLFMFIMWIGTLSIGQGLLTSVIEEKNSRVVEMLLAAVSPLQLMAGKILGMSAVAALLVGMWMLVGRKSADHFNQAHLVGTAQLVYLALYFVPGFLFSAALMATVGAACNTLKEAQGMMQPIALLNMIPLLLWYVIAQYPQSIISVIGSFIPPITPFVMILRMCADPDTPLWQVVATQAVLWASVAGMMWFAGRVFRVGVLMYGKPPTPRELWRWVRSA